MPQAYSTWQDILKSLADWAKGILSRALSHRNTCPVTRLRRFLLLESGFLGHAMLCVREGSGAPSYTGTGLQRRP